MTKLLQHIEEMRARLNQLAKDEQSLVNALGDALDRLDQQLLRDVRKVATDHEARREAILGELQNLASSIGMFRAPLPPPSGGDELPNYVPRHDAPQAIAPGDWRRATSNIEDELDLGLTVNGHGSH
jgi:hypothetical protein